MDTIFSDYENYLIGEAKDIGLYNFFGAEPGGANQQRALSLIRYALEEVLDWDVEECVNKFDAYMVKELKLERVMDFIIYPAEVRERDTRYVLSLLYPDRIRINFTEMVISIYDDVLEDRAPFPREYFVGVNGFFRYCICMQHLIMNYHPCNTLEELYQFILSPEGNKFLMEYRLKVPADHLKINILDCLREITKKEENSDLYYSYYSFITQLKKAYSPRAIPGTK